MDCAEFFILFIPMNLLMFCLYAAGEGYVVKGYCIFPLIGYDETLHLKVLCSEHSMMT